MTRFWNYLKDVFVGPQLTPEQLEESRKEAIRRSVYSRVLAGTLDGQDADREINKAFGIRPDHDADNY